MTVSRVDRQVGSIGSKATVAIRSTSDEMQTTGVWWRVGKRKHWGKARDSKAYDRPVEQLTVSQQERVLSYLRSNKTRLARIPTELIALLHDYLRPRAVIVTRHDWELWYRYCGEIYAIVLADSREQTKKLVEMALDRIAERGEGDYTLSVDDSQTRIRVQLSPTGPICPVGATGPTGSPGICTRGSDGDVVLPPPQRRSRAARREPRHERRPRNGDGHKGHR